MGENMLPKEEAKVEVSPEMANYAKAYRKLMLVQKYLRKEQEKVQRSMGELLKNFPTDPLNSLQGQGYAVKPRERKGMEG